MPLATVRGSMHRSGHFGGSQQAGVSRQDRGNQPHSCMEHSICPGVRGRFWTNVLSQLIKRHCKCRTCSPSSWSLPILHTLAMVQGEQWTHKARHFRTWWPLCASQRASGVFCNTPRLRSFAGEHVVKRLHHSYMRQPLRVRGKMYVEHQW